ncbi:MAG: thioesterase family protein [Betaproteobacteria bacterium]
MSRPVETARGTLHRWQCDHMGHINVRAYGERFEEACWQFYAMIGLRPSLLRQGEIHLAAVQQDIAYRKELYGGDVVIVRTTLLEVRDKVLRFVHEMINGETGDVAATSTFTVVCLDAAERRARPFPPDVLERARELLATDALASE